MRCSYPRQEWDRASRHNRRRHCQHANATAGRNGSEPFQCSRTIRDGPTRAETRTRLFSEYNRDRYGWRKQRCCRSVSTPRRATNSSDSSQVKHNKQRTSINMKTKTPLAATITIVVGATLSLAGCRTDPAVIAATGTNVGLDMSQNQVNQTPQIRFGYNRGEVAIVRTNGNPNDVPNVVMELKYSGIFSTSNAGIYQRLAVGSNAVSQGGAALMFLRDSDGKIDATSASAISNAVRNVPPLGVPPSAPANPTGTSTNQVVPKL